MRRQPHGADLARGGPERRNAPACAGPDAGACARSRTNTGPVTVADTNPTGTRPS